MRRVLLALGLGLALIAGLLATPRVGGAPPPPVSAPAEGRYAGPESCRPCHPDLYARWKRSAHARSTRRATPGDLPKEILEGRTVEHPPGRSTFRRDGDRCYVTTTGADGKLHEYPVTHVVGPSRISFFLTRMEDGRLQVLPAMREIPTGVWFDYTYLIFGVPGLPYDRPPIIRPGEPTFWTGPVRAYDRSCGRCHTSGRQAVVEEPDGRRRRDWSPLAIDCEACHGPAADHVAFWKNPPDRPAKDPLRDLSELTRERAVDVCRWCHMESEVVSLRFRPGEDVMESLSPTLLDNVERLDASGRPLELVYDGLPFSFSACAESGRLTCLSCHDAHGGPYRSDLLVPPDRTWTLCAGCHQDIVADPVKHSFHDPARSGGRCVSCHMPFLTIERGHGDVRDHTIGSPLPDLYGGRVATDACTWCHTGGRGAPGDAPRLTREAVYAAYRKWYPGAKLRPAWVESVAGARAGRADAFLPLVGTAGNRENPRLVRASAAVLLGKYGERALPYLSDLVEDEDSLVRRSAAAALGLIRHEDADLALGEALADRSPAVRFAAARAALSGWSRVRENRGLLQAVIPVLREDAAAVPLDDRRWFRLGAALQIAGDTAEAIRAYRRQLALDPYARNVRVEVERLERSLKRK